MNKFDQMYELLAALELALQESGWWEEHSPDADALASRKPFCVDTLRFSQWLQWVYLKKMRNYIATENALPEKSGLLAIAEEAWRGCGENINGLLLVVRALDALVNNDTDSSIQHQEVMHRYHRH